FAASSTVDVVEHYPGVGSTDFCGISFAFSAIDRQDMSSEALARELTLLRSCWAFFDEVRSRVSAEMQRGPRWGGVTANRSSATCSARRRRILRRTWGCVALNSTHSQPPPHPSYRSRPSTITGRFSAGFLGHSCTGWRECSAARSSELTE